MTKEEKLLYAIGEIDDELILAADEAAPKNLVSLPKKQWKKAVLTVACFLLCIGVWFSVSDLFRMGSSDSMTVTSGSASQNTTTTATTTETCIVEESEEAVEEESTEENVPAEVPDQKADKIGAEGGISTERVPYISYNVPLLPLDINEKTEGITAQRILTIDASTYYEDSTNALVNDEYLLLNKTDEDQEVTVMYSYGDDLRSMEAVTMTIEGSPAHTEPCLYVENTLNGFSDDGMNLSYDRGNYEDVLNQDWSSVNEMLPIYGGETVTVYEIYDPVIPADAPNAASLAIHFECEEDTLIWNNNFNGMQQDGEERCYDVFVSEFDRHPQMSRSIWIFGDAAPLEITVKGYTDGSCETELSGLTAKVRSYTMTLEEAIYQSMQQYVASNKIEIESVDIETLTNATLQYLKYSPLGSDPQSRYDMLVSWELYSDVLAAQRIFTVEQTLVIPANSSVQVTVQLEKQPNMVMESRKINFEGADFGSNLEVESFAVNFIKPEGGMIIEGNLSEGETKLDGSVDHWYVTCDTE